MMRRTRAFLRSNTYKSPEDAQREQDIFNRMLWDKDGKFKILNAAVYAWNEVAVGIKVVVGFGLLLYTYSKFIGSLQVTDAKTMRLNQAKREKALRETGKLRSDKYLVVQNRQIDDPDFGNFPAFGGKNTGWKSKAFNQDMDIHDDSGLGGPLQDERRVAK
jgi:hypothetical protein